ncbi:hypothetical protein NPIL_186151 [Nephila pilipes]|uniref:Uncharacterized protein n=1 Tax=Nephila pilipes TaxID=299642 RepID=A0A8X6SYK7_NEPPI|nr:hypothetical protein NPIL_186151 [Nephila pilipes]
MPLRCFCFYLAQPGWSSGKANNIQMNFPQNGRYVKMGRLTAEEALALMTELFDDDSFKEADIYLDTSSDEVANEDSSMKDCIGMGNLTEGQLRANEVLPFGVNIKINKLLWNQTVKMRMKFFLIIGNE